MGYVYLENFNRIGRVDSDGYIYSERSERLGKIGKDGRIYGEKFDYIGRIDSDGFIYLSNMKRIGRIHRDGYVYDELYNRVGKLDQDIVDYIFGKQTSSDSHSVTNSSSSGSNSFSSDLGAGFWAVLICTGLIIALFLGVCVGIDSGSFETGVGVYFGVLLLFIVMGIAICLV